MYLGRLSCIAQKDSVFAAPIRLAGCDIEFALAAPFANSCPVAVCTPTKERAQSERISGSFCAPPLPSDKSNFSWAFFHIGKRILFTRYETSSYTAGLHAFAYSCFGNTNAFICRVHCDLPHLNDVLIWVQRDAKQFKKNWKATLKEFRCFVVVQSRWPISRSDRERHRIPFATPCRVVLATWAIWPHSPVYWVVAINNM